MKPTPLVLGPSCSDGMVLQQGARAVVWGWSAPGSHHRLEVAGVAADAVSGDDGRWTAVWNGLAPGGPYPLYHNGEVLLGSVWIGDVWLCAGQSNMERSLEANAVWHGDPAAWQGDPGIRQLCLPNQFDFQAERRDIPGSRWIGADTPEVGKISAAGFHFARKLREATGIPQGLVLAAVGGSTAQAWLPVEDLEGFPDHRAEAARFAVPGWLEDRQKAEAARQGAWFSSLEALDPKDPVRAGVGEWHTVTLPSLARDNGLGDRSGTLWFRRRLTLGTTGDGSGRIRLGTLVDSDEVWINGTWVGATAYQYPSRRYLVPPGVLRTGDNEILIRLAAPRGGIGATPGKVWELQYAGGSVDLTGPWEWRPGASVPELPGDTFLPLVSLGLYNGMLAPLAPLGFRAVLWYQGESNLSRSREYGDLMAVLLTRWRRLFGRTDLPFVLVQLPLFGREEAYQADDGWAWVRDAQRRLAQTPDTALVVTLDAGEWNDIHPAHKQTVGERLALAARHLVLGESLGTWTGPLYRDGRREGAALRLGFSQTGDGLSLRDGQPCTGFYLAGPDGVYHPADAEVGRDFVVVRSSLVTEPVSARYAWASNPAGATLVNSLGIPASPFQT